MSFQTRPKKLREKEFLTGDFDHVYIVMSPLLAESSIEVSERRPEKWMKYVYAGVSVDPFNSKSTQEKEEYILTLMSDLLKSIALNDEQEMLVDDVYRLLRGSGSELEIIHIVKETSKYKVAISYQIRPLDQASKGLIEFHDRISGLIRKGVFIDLKHYEDIYALVASIAVSNGAVQLKPRTSLSASYRTKAYETPITIAIDEIPLAQTSLG